MEEEIDLPVTTTAGAGIRVVSPAVNIDFQDQDPKPPTVKSNAEVLQEIRKSDGLSIRILLNYLFPSSDLSEAGRRTTDRDANRHGVQNDQFGEENRSATGCCVQCSSYGGAGPGIRLSPATC